MDYRDQIRLAEAYFQLVLTEVFVSPTKLCLNKKEQRKVEKIKENFQPNSCLLNTYNVMKQIGVSCCEGVAYIIPDIEGNKNSTGAWIKHCWNKKEDKYFDGTLERFGKNIKEIHYFLLQECQCNDYGTKMPRGCKIEFVSKVEDVRCFLEKINDI